MASQRIEETGGSDHHLPYATLLHGINNTSSSAAFMNQEGPSFDFGELEEAIVLQGVKLRNDEPNKPSLFSAAGRTGATLEMFPSWPIRYQQQTPAASSKSGGESTEDSGSAVNYNLIGPESPMSNEKPNSSQLHNLQIQQVEIASDQSQETSQGNQNQTPAKSHHQKRRGLQSDKPLDAKTLRRLAQNREAARKSRLRKKAYVQQLESSRLKLSQLEQDLQRARQQGLFFGSCGVASANMSPGAAMFDMEYGRWLEDDQMHMSELRTALQANLSDGELRHIVDRCVSHYDEIFRLKGLAAKADVFHLITGMWSTPAERCFLWMGGFRPSELIKMLISQLDPLTDQQIMGIYNLQHSSQQAEEALTQGLEQLQQSLIDTVAAGSVVDGMQQMAVALNKLANLEGFVRQADNLRQQTIHQLQRILTIRQSARCFLVIGEYYNRLRALSSLWSSRPRGNVVNEESSCQTTTDLQMVQPAHSHLSNF